MSYRFIVTTAALAAQLTSVHASCAYGTWLQPRAADGTVEVNTFGYSGANGPANWVDLDPAANALCSSGANQSPIDMVADAFPIIPAAELSISLADFPDGTDFENLGTTVEVVTAVEGEAAAGSTMSFDGVTYTLQQFHFHLPSEHLDAGTSMAMEMHMVWQGEGGETAVIGVFVDIADGAGNATAPAAKSRRSSRHFRRLAGGEDAGKDRRQLPGIEGGFFHVTAPTSAATTASTLLETVFSSVADIAEPGTVTKTGALNMAELATILEAGSFQTYSGSLTTPPCSEGVRWLVSTQKLSISTASFISARSVIGFNARFPQNTLGEGNVLSPTPA